MKKFRRAFRHHFDPNSVCDKNTDRRRADVQSPILWNFRFRWHLCKNHICIRLFVQCFQLAHPVIHCRDWNVMFLTPCFSSLPTGLKFMDSFRPQCDFFILFHNWIFLCGNTASPAGRKPPVRTNGNRLCKFTRVMFCLIYRLHALRCHVRHHFFWKV